MKRLLMLAIVAVVTTASVGCGLFDRCRRGPECDTCPTAGSPYVPGPTVSGPATETYLPAPG